MGIVLIISTRISRILCLEHLVTNENVARSNRDTWLVTSLITLLVIVSVTLLVTLLVTRTLMQGRQQKSEAPVIMNHVVWGAHVLHWRSQRLGKEKEGRAKAGISPLVQERPVAGPRRAVQMKSESGRVLRGFANWKTEAAKDLQSAL